MAKKKDQKLKNKAEAVSQQEESKKIKKVTKAESINTTVPAQAPLVARSLAPVIDGSEAISRDEEKGNKLLYILHGFIFMCNASTKPECYKNRLFGLPAGAKEIVEKIKPGAKLFLFDFDLKLLYGIYEASSPGKLDLEPDAFGGRFRAQVRFRIYKDCIPLPESQLRTAIKDNYKGSKFTQELNDQQVKNLVSLFQPIVASSSAPLFPPVPNAVPPRPMSRGPHSAFDGQYPLSLTPFVDPYLAGMIHGRPPPVNGPLPVHHNMLYPQYRMYESTSAADHVHPYTGHLGLPAPSGPYQYTETRQPFLSVDPVLANQELYRRYTTVPDAVPQPVGLESGYHHELALQREREIAAQYDNAMGYGSSYPIQTDPYGQSNVQPYVPQQVQMVVPTPQRPGLPEVSMPTPYVPQYVQPPPSVSETGRPAVADGKMPISSYYSFAGASRVMR